MRQAQVETREAADAISVSVTGVMPELRPGETFTCIGAGWTPLTVHLRQPVGGRRFLHGPVTDEPRRAS